MHVSFDETNPSKEDIVSCDDDDVLDMPIEDVTKANQNNNQDYLIE